MAFGIWGDIWDTSIWDPAIWGAAAGPSVPTAIIDQGASAWVRMGATLQLSANSSSGSPTPTFGWESDTIGVATVSATGLVTPVSEGSCIITLTATNSEGFDTDTIAIEVRAALSGSTARKIIMYFRRR